MSGSTASTDGDNDDDDQRVVVVFAAGRSFDLEAHVEEHGPFPPWFVVKRWIPQLGVLRRASVFFSHCGLVGGGGVGVVVVSLHIAFSLCASLAN